MQIFSNLILIVYDQDFLQSNASLQINVQDVNDNSPTFSSDAVMQILISETIPLLSEIFAAVATDADSTSNSQLSYSLGDSSILDFSINSVSGAVFVNRALDYEMRMNYLLDIVASDGGFPSRNASLTLNVTIMDENDNSPVIVDPLPLSVRENVGLGQFIGEIEAFDIDSGVNSVLNYEIAAGNEAGDFAIDSVSGFIFTNGSIDREQFSSYSLIIEVKIK